MVRVIWYKAPDGNVHLWKDTQARRDFNMMNPNAPMMEGSMADIVITDRTTAQRMLQWIGTTYAATPAMTFAESNLTNELLNQLFPSRKGTDAIEANSPLLQS